MNMPLNERVYQPLCKLFNVTYINTSIIKCIRLTYFFAEVYNNAHLNAFEIQKFSK